MKAFYHDIFTFPLPENRSFPINKYQILRKRLVDLGILAPDKLHIPNPASDDQLLLVLDKTYLDKVISGHLTDTEIRRIGFPWSPELVERSRRSVGSTISTTRTAIDESIAINLAGGTHHAFSDFGAGYCIFNDVAVAARTSQSDCLVKNILILDCDVHQGDGTANIFSDDPSVFTFSIHANKNFPFRKQKSDLDIGLPDNTGDDEYLQALELGLEQVFNLTNPDVAIYIAGADPYVNDRLGRLALTKAGMAKRDLLILNTCLSAGVPVAITLGGGYAFRLDDIVDIHLETVRIAVDIFTHFIVH
jgi:acetoin utilization deacetylase AcuC-like enzyme